MTKRQIEQRSEQYPQGYIANAPWYDYDAQRWMVNDSPACMKCDGPAHEAH